MKSFSKKTLAFFIFISFFISALLSFFFPFGLVFPFIFFPWLMSKGWRIYVELKDFHTPFLFYILNFAHSLFGYSLTAHKALSTVIFGTANFLSLIIFSQYFGRLVALASIFLSFLLVLIYEGNAINYNPVLAIFNLLGFYFFSRIILSRGKNTHLLVIWASLVLGVGYMIKQHVVVSFILPVLFLLSIKKISLKQFWLSILFFSLPLLLYIFYSWRQGFWDDFLFLHFIWQIFYPSYRAIRFPQYGDLLQIFSLTSMVIIYFYSLLFDKKRRNFNLLLMIIFFSSLAPIIPYYSYYYFLSALPFISLFAIQSLSLLLRSRKRIFTFSFITLALIINFTFVWQQKRYLNPKNDIAIINTPPKELIEYVGQNIKPDEDFYVFEESTVAFRLYPILDRLPGLDYYYQTPQENFLATQKVQLDLISQLKQRRTDFLIFRENELFSFKKRAPLLMKYIVDNYYLETIIEAKKAEDNYLIFRL